MVQTINVPGQGLTNFPDNMTDDEIVASIKKNKMEKIAQIIGANQTPWGNIQDFLYGGGKTMAGLAKLFTGGYAPDMPDIRQKNPNAFAVGLGEYLPYALAGGASLLGSTAAAAAYGGTQYEPSQHGFIDTFLHEKYGIPYGGRVRNIIEDALINVAGHGLIAPLEKLFHVEQKPIENINFKNQVEFPTSESEFTNVPFQPPSFLKEKSPMPLSGNITDEITNNIMGNRNLEQAGRELASHLKNTYEAIREPHSQEFDRILNSPTDDVSIQTDEPILTKEKLMFNSNYKKNNPLAETKDKNLSLLDKKFMGESNIENAHKLQSELGSEIGYLKRQREKDLLDAEGKNRLDNYVKAQNLLHEDIRSQLHEIHPQLQVDYDLARENWLKNVIPYHSDKDLREIVEGKIKNPESNKIISIFKNPEENINKITNDLNPEAKNRITHIALGKVKEDLTPEQLLNARKNLDINGLSSYISPEQEQNFRALRANLQAEKEHQQRLEANKAFIKGLQDIQEQQERRRLSLAKKREQSFQKAQNVSNKIFEENKKNIETDYQRGLQEQLEKEKYFKNMLKKVIASSVAVAGIKGLGLNETELLAAYLAKFPKKLSGKK